MPSSDVSQGRGRQVSRVTRRVGGQFVDAENSPPVVSPLQHVEAPVGLRKRVRIPSPASNATSTWRFTASWLTTTTVPPLWRRAMSVSPLTARFRTADRGSTPGAAVRSLS